MVWQFSRTNRFTTRSEVVSPESIFRLESRRCRGFNRVQPLVEYFDAHALRLAQHQIHYPATSDMDATVSAVIQNIVVVAPRVLKSVSENGEAVEGFFGVDARGESKDG